MDTLLALVGAQSSMMLQTILGLTILAASGEAMLKEVGVRFLPVAARLPREYGGYNLKSVVCNSPSPGAPCIWLTVSVVRISSITLINHADKLNHFRHFQTAKWRTF